MDTTMHVSQHRSVFSVSLESHIFLFPSAHKNKILSTSKMAIIGNYRILDYMVHNLSLL